MKKIIALTVAALMLGLTSCKKTPAEDADSNTASKASSAATDPEGSASDRAIAKPETSLINSNTLSISGDMENVDSVRIYSCEVSSASRGEVTQNLIFDGTVEDISSGEITFDADNVLSTENYDKDNSSVISNYHAMGVKVCVSNEQFEEWSELMLLDASLDTGVCDQHDCAFEGETACGAANGALLLQTVQPVWGDELIARMNAIRDYSALGYDYSEMEDGGYRMTGSMVSNSVNRYMADNGISGCELTDIAAENKSTEELIIEAINTGRPAAVIAAYRDGEILTEYDGDRRWITINAYRIDENGDLWFRWENTLKNEERWVESETIETAVQAFIDDDGDSGATERTLLTLSDGSEIKVTRYVISLSRPVVDSLL